jgi:hypothetical protein
MSPQLFLLPGELRNKIYEYALSEEKGLDYVKDAQGVGWLCLHKSQTEVKHAGNIELEKNRSKPTIFSPGPTTMCIVNGGHIVANQLQFVCWQLRHETKTLGILYNTITFGGLDPTVALSFMTSLPFRLKDHTHDFILRVQEDAWYPRKFSELVELCQAHPRCKLKFYHPKLDSSRALRLIFTALLIKHGARRDTTFVQMLSGNVAFQLKLVHMVTKEIEDQHVASIPDNVVFYPFDMYFDEDAFRSSCEKVDVIQKVLVPTLENGVEGLVALARACYEQGI